MHFSILLEFFTFAYSSLVSRRNKSSRSSFLRQPQALSNLRPPPPRWVSLSPEKANMTPIPLSVLVRARRSGARDVKEFKDNSQKELIGAAIRAPQAAVALTHPKTPPDRSKHFLQPAFAASPGPGRSAMPCAARVGASSGGRPHAA